MRLQWIAVPLFLAGLGAEASTWTRDGVRNGASSTEAECAGHGDTAAWVVV